MAVSYDSGAYVIDAADGKLRFALAAGYPRMLWGPDDRRLLVLGVRELSVYAGDDGTYQTGFAVEANSRAIHFLDHDTALCGTRDGFVYRLDFATGKHEVVTKGLGNIIEISPDGQQLAVDHGGLSIHSLDGQLLTSFLSLGDPLQPLIISADGHFWSNDQSQGPFWATKGSVPNTLVYVVQTASGQQTLTPVEFANRYGWQNDPSQVRLK
ncbi:MAG: hypothetical protein IAG10_01505 [Planctomycetaceae bacterium]|nr:hypothetical protein [Planctomycetaceae bacterium]